MASAPATVAAPWVRQVTLLVTGVGCLFVSTTLLVPVVPVLAERTAGSSGAGIATAAFYFPAVCVQLAMPSLLRRVPTAPLLVTGLLLAGLPSLLYTVLAERLSAVLAATAVRGIGFGVATVALLTVVAQVAPAGRRGMVIGTAGLASGLPLVVCPALGTYLLARGDEDVAFVAAAVVAAVGALGLTRVARPALPPAAALRLREALTGPLLWPFAWFLLVSLTRGAVVSFVPIRLVAEGLASAASFFLVFGLFGYAARWGAGWLADRVPARALAVPGAVCVLSGLVLLAAGLETGYVLASAALYGLGTGALMTLSQLDMLARSTRASFAVPTAIWNVSIDFGVGLGGVVFGLVAAGLGYDTAFWLLPAVLVVVLVLVAIEPRPETRLR